MPPPTMAANGAWLPYTNTFQYPPQAVNPMHMGNEWIEVQRKATETSLKNRGFPPNTWNYYLEAPRDWDIDDIDPVGVHRGVKAILTSRGSVNPWWIPDSDNGKKVKLSTSFTRVIQTLEEVKRFKSESMPDDSQLNAEYNRAEKRASKLHEKLQEACNDLSALASCSDQINFEFYDFILDFVDKIRLNDEAREKANKMKELLSSRGICYAANERINRLPEESIAHV